MSQFKSCDYQSLPVFYSSSRTPHPNPACLHYRDFFFFFCVVGDSNSDFYQNFCSNLKVLLEIHNRQSFDLKWWRFPHSTKNQILSEHLSCLHRFPPKLSPSKAFLNPIWSTPDAYHTVTLLHFTYSCHKFSFMFSFHPIVLFSTPVLHDFYFPFAWPPLFYRSTPPKHLSLYHHPPNLSSLYFSRRLSLSCT